MVLDGAYIQWRDADNKAGGENAGLPAAPDEVDAVIAKLSVHTMVGAGDLDEFLRRNRSWFLRGFNHVTVQSRLWGVDNPLDEFASQAILEELQLLELIEIEARVPDKDLGLGRRELAYILYRMTPLGRKVLAKLTQGFEGAYCTVAAAAR